MLRLQACRISACLSLLAPLLVLQTGRAFETGISFSGTLERLGNQSISIRLPDRRLIDAMLPNTPDLGASSIAAQYTLGDQVEIACKPIHRVWEKSTARYQYLEVTTIRLVRRPSPEELASAAVSKPAILPPASGPGATELEHARRINLDYLANMPNFVADETAKRFRSTTQSPHWRPFDTVESEITFRGNHAVRQQIRRNGKPWEQPFEALPGFKWYEGFGTEINPLFDPRCPTTIEYQGRSNLGGGNYSNTDSIRQWMDAFHFYFDYQRYNPARTGHVFIDDPGGNVIQLDEEARGFPMGLEFSERQEHVSFDYVKIGQDSHLLPVRAGFLVLYNSGTRYRVEVEYKNHRHFETSTNVTFH